MNKEDGGPAFPTEPNTQPGFFAHHGMSLRYYFAGQALAGYLAGNNLRASDPEATAAKCYAIADAMLKARES